MARATSASATTQRARARASWAPKARAARRRSSRARGCSPSWAMAMPRSASAGGSSRTPTCFRAPSVSPKARARAAAAIRESIATACCAAPGGCALLQGDDDPLALLVVLHLEQRAVHVWIGRELDDFLELDAFVVQGGHGLPGNELDRGFQDGGRDGAGGLRAGVAALEYLDLQAAHIVPRCIYRSVAAIRRISCGVCSPASGVPGIRCLPMASPPMSTGS